MYISYNCYISALPFAHNTAESGNTEPTYMRETAGSGGKVIRQLIYELCDISYIPSGLLLFGFAIRYHRYSSLAPLNRHAGRGESDIRFAVSFASRPLLVTHSSSADPTTIQGTLAGTTTDCVLSVRAV